MDLFEKCRKYTRADEIKQAGLYPYFHPISETFATEVIIEGKRLIMVGSNNYLGLTQHPKVKEAAIHAIEKYGTGNTGSRFLNGTIDLHEKLEDALAQFVGKEAALVFTTGFLTNQGTIAAIVGRDDYVVTDKLNHASIYAGCRMAFGETKKFKHNDMMDLERILSSLEKKAGILVVTDGIFSMEGDIVNLPEVLKICKKHHARLMIDDAHSLGVLGKMGEGTAAHFGMQNDVDMIMGTFSKSFASLGGFLAADRIVIDFLKHNCKELIFSASMPPASVAAVLAALDVIKSEPDRIKQLWNNANYMRENFKNLGFDTGISCTPIIPIIIGDDLSTFKFWRTLFDNGIFTNPVVSPATPPKRALIRTSYMATHTREELDQVLDVFKKVGKSFGLIS